MGRIAHLSPSVTILAAVYMSTTLTNAAERDGGDGEVKNRRISPFLLMKECFSAERAEWDRAALKTVLKAAIWPGVTPSSASHSHLQPRCIIITTVFLGVFLYCGSFWHGVHTTKRDILSPWHAESAASPLTLVQFGWKVARILSRQSEERISAAAVRKNEKKKQNKPWVGICDTEMTRL